MKIESQESVVLNAAVVIGRLTEPVGTRILNSSEAERAMTRKWSAFLICIAVALISAQAVFAQGDSAVHIPLYRARLVGVYDATAGEPLAGVRIIDVLSGSFVETGANGAAHLAFLPQGASILRLTKVGFAPKTFPVEISPRDTGGITILMDRVQELPKVVTTSDAVKATSPRLRGFEQRRKSEAGYFITEEQLRKNDGRPLANVLTSSAPGVVINRTGNHSYLAQSPQCMDGTKAGPPAVFLDGVQITDMVSGPASLRANSPPPPVDLTAFDVTDLAAVEWYPSTARMPMEFSHFANRCGALMLWTRDR
jgi:hypothetical protein